MPYTQARLDHALRVFKEAHLHIHGRGFKPNDINHQARRKYHLRAPAGDTSLRQVWHPICQRACTSDSDDEYDPNHDKRKRRKANAEVKRTKIAKRKSTDLGDEERRLKAARCAVEQEDEDNISTYVTIKITSNPGRQLLKNFAREYGTGAKTESEPKNAAEWQSFPLSNGAITSLDLPVYEARRHRQALRRKLEHEITLQELELETATLRNGKRRDKKIDKKRKRESVDQADSVDGKNNESYSHEQSATPQDPVIQEENTAVSQSIAPMQSFTVSRGNDIARHAPTDQTPLQTPIDLFDKRIQTSYAHPIYFKHCPKKTLNDPCSFCDDYRMGVIGLSKRKINVRVYPDKPHEYHELGGGGHRADGHSPTKMCVLCSLNRLQMRRCHSNEDTHAPQFELIPGHDNVNFSRYIQEMFAAPDPSKRHWTQVSGRSKRRVWPSCSICPGPAIWRCAQWQKTTITKTPRFVPAAGQAWSSSSASSTGLASPPSSRSESQSTILAPPVRGCGLLLCTQCKDFMATQCAGVIDKDKLLHYLRTQNRLGQRADLEFLFPGSLLEMAMRFKERRSTPS